MKDFFFSVLWGFGAFAAGSVLILIGIVALKSLYEELFGR